MSALTPTDGSVSCSSPTTKLTGDIPRELGNFSNLHDLYLRGNELTGEIPRELGRHDLYLSDNELAGEIPTDWAASPTCKGWTSPPRRVCAGEIPTELGNRDFKLDVAVTVGD